MIQFFFLLSSIGMIVLTLAQLNYLTAQLTDSGNLTLLSSLKIEQTDETHPVLSPDEVESLITILNYGPDVHKSLLNSNAAVCLLSKELINYDSIHQTFSLHLNCFIKSERGVLPYLDQEEWDTLSAILNQDSTVPLNTNALKKLCYKGIMQYNLQSSSFHLHPQYQLKYDESTTSLTYEEFMHQNYLSLPDTLGFIPSIDRLYDIANSLMLLSYAYQSNLRTKKHLLLVQAFVNQPAHFLEIPNNEIQNSHQITHECLKKASIMLYKILPCFFSPIKKQLLEDIARKLNKLASFYHDSPLEIEINELPFFLTPEEKVYWSHRIKSIKRLENQQEGANLCRKYRYDNQNILDTRLPELLNEYTSIINNMLNKLTKMCGSTTSNTMQQSASPHFSILNELAKIHEATSSNTKQQSASDLPSITAKEFIQKSMKAPVMNLPPWMMQKRATIKNSAKDFSQMALQVSSLESMEQREETSITINPFTFFEASPIPQDPLEEIPFEGKFYS